MILNSGADDAKLDALKAWLDANAAGLTDEQAAALLNAAAAPDYWVWRSSISRAAVYHATSPTGSTWNWTAYKAQDQREQGAWTQMFMGDSAPIGNLNFRAGVHAIFSGTQTQVDQRNHVFAAGRRRATAGEKLFAVAVADGTANTGNDGAQARGSAANPDNLGSNAAGQYLEGPVTVANVSAARNRP